MVNNSVEEWCEKLKSILDISMNLTEQRYFENGCESPFEIVARVIANVQRTDPGTDKAKAAEMVLTDRLGSAKIAEVTERSRLAAIHELMYRKV